MAWSTALTAVSNAALTAAQWNASVRDNLAETAPAKATATGRIFVTTGANAIAERIPSIGRVTGGGQGTTSTSFVDLTTVGPNVNSLTTGTSAIFAVSSFCLNTQAANGCYMGVAVSSASTIAADVNRSLRVMSGAASENSKGSYVGMFGGTLTAGSNTFSAKYAALFNTGTATFDERELLVIPL
jgi:hypothetical protein